MKKLLLNRIRQGEFNPSTSIQTAIDDLNKTYSRAKKTVERMHGGDEITLEESMSREFRYYSTALHKLQIKQYEDEQKRLSNLRKELLKLFGVDVWDYIIFNTEFDSLEELYENTKLYVRENYA